MLQMANISSFSQVLLVDSTKGFLTGVLCEKQVDTILKVEEDLGRLEQNIYLEFDFPQDTLRRV